MSGYKRVNFYELCRLCATNQQKEKTHIFREEGRKIQLQNKIQSCLSLKVCENDFLPKVVCSRCLRTLEECSSFRKECYTSETMLSSYFNNFRYTEDFKRSGKVYIKDVSPKVENEVKPDTNAALCNNPNNINVIQSVSASVSENTLPYYTLQIPATHTGEKQPRTDPTPPKVVSASVPAPQFIYNLNGGTVKPVTSPNISQLSVKTSSATESVGNLTLNSNGEIFAVTAPLIELDALLNQSVVARPAPVKKSHRARTKPTEKGPTQPINGYDDSKVIKIDLTQSEHEDHEKHVKAINGGVKISYTTKLEESLKTTTVRLANGRPVKLYNGSSAGQTTVNCNANIVDTNAGGIYSTFNAVPFSINSKLTDPLQIDYGGAAATVMGDALANIFNAASSIASAAPPTGTANIPKIEGTPQNISYSAATHHQEMYAQDHNLVSLVSNHQIEATNTSLQTNHVSKLESTGVVVNGLSETGSINVNGLDPPKQHHQQQHHHQTTAPPAAGLPPTPSLHQKAEVRQHMCDVCSKAFRRREHLYQHVKLHTGFRPHRCENCNKTFMRKEHLMRHMTSHSGLKNYTCNICEKSFSRNDNLLKHKKIHSKQSSFTCEVCHKQFVMEHYYLAHRHTHEVNGPGGGGSSSGGDKCPTTASVVAAAANSVWNLLKTV